MKHVWSILCHKSIIDQETNALSLIDSLEEITIDIKKGKQVDKINLQGISYNLVSYIVRSDIKEKEKGEIKIEIIDPQNNLIKEITQPFEIKKGVNKIRVQMQFNGLIISGEGRYTYRIGLKNEETKKYNTVAELPLDIKYNIINSNTN
ncbi:hypothetical protein KAI92_00405 [Candidatus Parcubacteria bacterium]|nr:hypothetical protein [Candidatus Parcubacteria bacterium]